jgi:hypothetical protein
MRVRRAATTALLTLATTGTLLAVAGGTASAAPCPGGSVPPYSAGVCETFTVTPTTNTGFTVEGTVFPYCSNGVTVDCSRIIAQMFNDYPYLYATGVDVNGSTPPVPVYDPTTGQVAAPNGSYGTVYADGLQQGINTPAYCVTINVPCP